jgi:Xaa-Pro aminopeptidase
VTEIDIATEIDGFARAEGCDGFGYPTLVSFGRKMRAPHSPPLRRVIPPNQVIRVAFGPTYDGYSADVIRTFVIGEPEPLVYRLRDAFVEAQHACLTSLKPGATSPELLETVRGIYDRHDVTQFWGGSIGHGIGITIHEPPRVQKGDTTALPADAIVAIEPTVGNAGYAQCDVARVTPVGGEWLAPCELDLVVIR